MARMQDCSQWEKRLLRWHSEQTFAHRVQLHLWQPHSAATFGVRLHGNEPKRLASMCLSISGARMALTGGELP